MIPTSSMIRVYLDVLRTRDRALAHAAASPFASSSVPVAAWLSNGKPKHEVTLLSAICQAIKPPACYLKSFVKHFWPSAIAFHQDAASAYSGEVTVLACGSHSAAGTCACDTMASVCITVELFVSVLSPPIHRLYAPRPGSYAVKGWTSTRTVVVSDDAGFSCSCLGFREECDICHHIFSVIKHISLVSRLESVKKLAYVISLLMRTRWWLTRYACESSVTFASVMTRFEEFKAASALRVAKQAAAAASAAEHAAAKVTRDSSSHRGDGVARRASKRQREVPTLDSSLEAAAALLAVGGDPIAHPHCDSV
jgi:hypothetical protein